MIKRREEFGEKNRKDAKITDNSFTRAVKRAGKGGEREEEDEKKENFDPAYLITQPPSELTASELKARDELMRAKEARNDTTSETDRFRRDEN